MQFVEDHELDSIGGHMTNSNGPNGPNGPVKRTIWQALTGAIALVARGV